MHAAAEAGGAALAHEAGRQSLARHGSTFHAAHLLLGRREAEDVRLLYGFFRHIDDLVDEQPHADAVRGLAGVRSDLERGESAAPELEGYLAFRARHAVDPRVTDAFLAGVEQDLVQQSYGTEADLLRYCYRVAGTVGLHMCALFDVTDARAAPFAIDLGIGMQLTNIARDVLEDAERGRVYLPAEGTGGPLSAAALVARDPAALARARACVERLLPLAKRYYRSADAGMGYLPPRARLAVLTASRCYGAIGGRILAHPRGTLPGRVRVDGARKLAHFGRALGRAGGVALETLRGREPLHGAELHRAELHLALAGLPGVDDRGR